MRIDQELEMEQLLTSQLLIQSTAPFVILAKCCTLAKTMSATN